MPSPSPPPGPAGLALWEEHIREPVFCVGVGCVEWNSDEHWVVVGGVVIIISRLPTTPRRLCISEREADPGPVTGRATPNAPNRQPPTAAAHGITASKRCQRVVHAPPAPLGPPIDPNGGPRMRMPGRICMRLPFLAVAGPACTPTPAFLGPPHGTTGGPRPPERAKSCPRQSHPSPTPPKPQPEAPTRSYVGPTTPSPVAAAGTTSPSRLSAQARRVWSRGHAQCARRFLDQGRNRGGCGECK